MRLATLPPATAVYFGHRAHCREPQVCRGGRARQRCGHDPHRGARAAIDTVDDRAGARDQSVPALDRASRDRGGACARCDRRRSCRRGVRRDARSGRNDFWQCRLPAMKITRARESPSAYCGELTTSLSRSRRHEVRLRLEERRRVRRAIPAQRTTRRRQRDRDLRGAAVVRDVDRIGRPTDPPREDRLGRIGEVRAARGVAARVEPLRTAAPRRAAQRGMRGAKREQPLRERPERRRLRGQVEPGRGRVEVVRIVVALGAMAELVAAGDHRHARRQQLQREPRARVAWRCAVASPP